MTSYHDILLRILSELAQVEPSIYWRTTESYHTYSCTQLKGLDLANIVQSVPHDHLESQACVSCVCVPYRIE
jgi:hypothetical protein